jgi:hypothetical protein
MIKLRFLDPDIGVLETMMFREEVGDVSKSPLQCSILEA